MPYETRPYIPFVPFAPNPLKKYEVREGKLFTYYTLFDLPILRFSAGYRNLDDADPTPHAGVFGHAANMGGVRVETQRSSFDVYRLRDREAFMAAIERAQSEAEESAEEKSNWNEADLADFLIFYPHIPKAVETLLRHIEPENFTEQSYTNRVKVGEWVTAGTVVASYGGVEISCPVDGRIEMIGHESPGLHEWPDRKPNPEIDPGEDPEGFLREHLNSGSLVFPETVPVREAYSFSVRPICAPATYPTSVYIGLSWSVMLLKREEFGGARCGGGVAIFWLRPLKCLRKA